MIEGNEDAEFGSTPLPIGGEVTNAVDNERAALAHVLVHGLYASLSNLAMAASTVHKMLDAKEHSLAHGELTRIERLLQVLRYETDSQIYQALSYLQHVNPQSLPGLIRPRIGYYSPLEVISRMIPAYEHIAQKRGIRIEVKQAEGVDDTMPEIELELNSIGRVFHNILSNAVKYSYSDKSAPDRYIRVWAQRHDSAARLWSIKVQNYGIGVLPEERASLFKAGFRGECAKDENPFGTGLGLWDAQEIMRRHGGHVRLDSKHLHEDTFLTTVSVVFPSQSSIRASGFA